MKSVIKDIFNGFRGHRDTMNLPKDSQQYLRTVCQTQNELNQKLQPELLELYQRFVDAFENNLIEEVDFYFVEGFKLGLLVGIECSEG